MENNNTNWSQSVTGVVIKNGKVLLARHTYGSGKGMFIVPGGYVEYGESPQDAVKREYLEETHVQVEPKEIIGVRFNNHDWYIAFAAEYVAGEPVSDGDENDAVVWMDVEEAQSREDVPDLTKKLIRCALEADKGLKPMPYEGNPKNGKGYLYGIVDIEF
uniref:NUDIX domain-containing protein n=1 Tax=Acetatifactor sp. TaxID=1872090 RepID=UPI00405768AD